MPANFDCLQLQLHPPPPTMTHSCSLPLASLLPSALPLTLERGCIFICVRRGRTESKSKLMSSHREEDKRRHADYFWLPLSRLPLPPSQLRPNPARCQSLTATIKLEEKCCQQFGANRHGQMKWALATSHSINGGVVVFVLVASLSRAATV